jgi:DNA-directed RNA polymerase subunit alpha
VEVDQETLTANYACFSIEPFEKGFGHTIGNGLRRVLLSSIEGTAVTSVQIEGVLHEFTTLPGVLEDTTEIVLNLKGLQLALDEQDSAEVALSRNKKGELRARDIVVPAGVRVLNPDHLICTLTDDAEVTMMVTVARGRGYVTSEEHGSQDETLGVIALDSNFSPVARVRYRVEETRVGKITNYDRLVLEVWTDGTVKAEAALVEASRIYRKHLNAFVHYGDVGKMIPIADSARVPETTVPQETDSELSGVLGTSIDDLDLSVRSRHCLDSENITSVGRLVQMTEAELLKVRNFGQTSLDEVNAKLEGLGLRLGMQPEFQEN